MYFRMSDVADTMFFFSKKYQEIVVLHKHKLTMAGTTELEQHGTRTGTEKKNTRNTRIQRQKNVRKGVPPPWVHFYKGKKMYARAPHPLEYIFQGQKNVLKGVPPRWVHFYKSKKCTQGRPTPLSTFLQGQKMYWRASHPLEYIFTTAKNVLEGVPPPWVHFYKGKKCTGGRPTPLSTFLQGQKKCTQGRPTPLSTFLHSKTKKCNHTRGTSLSTFSLLALRQKNVLKGVGGPWVHFCIAKKKVLKGVGRPWVHFLYSSPGKKMYWRGWDPLQYIFFKKCTGIRGTYFCSIFFFWGGGVFGLKKMYWPLVTFFFAVFPPHPPPSGTHVGGVPSTFSTLPPPPRKNVHYIFGGPPLKLGVKGVGMTQLQSIIFVWFVWI